MSNIDTRAAIAAAASTVDGVTCTPNYRQSLSPGDAFVRLDRRARSENGYGYMDTWQVWLALPQDQASAETWLDTNIDALTAALSAEIVVTAITPAELVPGPTPVNGVIFEGAREDSN